MTETGETADGQALSALLHETRRFEPPAGFVSQANAKPGIYEDAERDPEAWWAEQAEWLTWDHHWHTTLEWEPPDAKWFVGGRLNASWNCVDRHVEAGNGEKVAFHWVGEPEGDTRTITYRDLRSMVCQAANALTEVGVRAGDRVAIYMPMVPEAAVAMLACARIGAPHSVVFGGFSGEALAGRVLDADARVVITADGGYRRGAPSALKPQVDEALRSAPNVRTVVVVRRTGEAVDWEEGATTGGTISSGASKPTTNPLRSMPSIPSTSCTPVARRPSPRECSTPRGGTSCTSQPRTGSCSTSSPRRTCSGRLRTSGGSRGTATSSTAPWRTAPRP